jgi:hypothetical protein
MSGPVRKREGQQRRAVIGDARLAKHADAIRALRRLAVVKKIVGHGNWLPWLDREFGWSEDTAERFIRVHEFVESLSDSASVRNLVLTLPVSSVYLLAAPSTPEAARSEIIERAKGGEVPPVGEVKKVVDKHKPTRRKEQKPPTPQPPMLSPRDDVGPGSTRETERLQARVDKLQNDKSQLEHRATTSEQRAALLERQLADAKSATTTLRSNARAPINETLLGLSALIAGGGEIIERFILRVLIEGAKAVAEGDADFEQARRVLAKFGDTPPPSGDGLDIPASLQRACNGSGADGG